MGAANDTQRFTLPDNLTQDYLIPYAFSNTAIAVGIGDLCYFKGQITSPNGDVAYPADQFTSLTNEALDQAAFASAFVGVSEQQILSSETNINKRFVVRTDGVCDFKCPSQTWRHGDPVGIFSNGTTLDPQQVDACKASAGIIGFVVKDYPVATTRVRIVLMPGIAGNVPASGTRAFQMGAITNDNITNTSTETAFATTATIPANVLVAQDIIHVHAIAQVLAQNSTNTNRFRLEILTTTNTYTTIYDSGNLNIAANGLALIDFDLVFTAIGGSGSFYAIGDAAVGNNNSATRAVQFLTATTISTNVNVTVRLTDTVNAASTGNNAQLQLFNVFNERR